MIFKHEIKHYFPMVLIWSLVISFFLYIVVAIYPMMAKDMSSIVGMVKNLGPFGKALKIDGLMLDQLMGYYAMEMENMLGIGGAFFAGYLAIKILAKEEGGHTAEFLLTHPVSRKEIYLEKYFALVTILLIFNSICLLVGWLSVQITQQSVPSQEFLRMHLAILLVQVCLATFIYGISAFLRSDNMGVGLGLVFVLYFMNIFINLYSKLDFLKYFTPFQFSYAADVLSKGLNWNLIAMNLGLSLVIFFIGFSHYNRKDIHG